MMSLRGNDISACNWFGIGINGNSKSDFIIFGKALQVINYLKMYWGTVRV